MYRLIYILPIIAIGVAYLLVGIEQIWFVYLIMLILAEALVYWAMYRALRVVEYLSGYATDAYHHEAWTERVVRHQTYTDSRGNVKTRTVVSYVYHPDKWFICLNTGEDIDITEDSYASIVDSWDSEEMWIDVPHINCVSGGGGQMISFDGEYEHMVTATYEGLYVNYVRGSNSIFRHEPLSRREAQRLGLVDYPRVGEDSLDVDAILQSAKLSGVDVDRSDQQHIQRINAYYGAEAEIHIFVILFDAVDGIAMALKQRQYWHGGNKNELVVCLGVEPSIDASSPHQVAWCKAFSWCDAPMLDNATESYFLEHRTLDFGAYAEWLRKNISLWRRKEFSEFKYIGKRLSPRRVAMVTIFTLFISAIMVLIMVFMKDM